MEHGLITNLEVRLVKFDPELFGGICKRRGISSEEGKAKVKEALKYNIFSTKMFSDMTGLAESTITNKCRVMRQDTNGEISSELDFTRLFAGMDEGSKGFRFIVRNEKSEALLRK